MRVLVACESSGVVRDAFTRVGCEAWSCDLLPSTAPGLHHQVDARVAIREFGPWDLLIAHPPCTYLCASGMHWTTRGLRDPRLTVEAARFAADLWNADVPWKCIENPTGHLTRVLGEDYQAVQPYQFGDDASKRTCLWLRGGLPRLRIDGDKFVFPRLVCRVCRNVIPPGHDQYRDTRAGCGACGADAATWLPRWANQTDSGQNRLGPSKDRWSKRSRTYPGIAQAMAEQWGRLL